MVVIFSVITRHYLLWPTLGVTVNCVVALNFSQTTFLRIALGWVQEQRVWRQIQGDGSSFESKARPVLKRTSSSSNSSRYFQRHNNHMQLFSVQRLTKMRNAHFLDQRTSLCSQYWLFLYICWTPDFCDQISALSQPCYSRIRESHCICHYLMYTLKCYLHYSLL